MAKGRILSSKNAALFKMQLLNGAEKLKKMLPPLTIITTPQDEMYAVMVHVVKEELQEDLLRSPFKYFPIGADEATDISNASIAIVFIRYVNSQGRVISKFIGSGKLQATISDEI